MEYIEGTNDYVARNANGIYFYNWLIYDWERQLYTYYGIRREGAPLNDATFTVGDNHVELYDCVFDEEPYTTISPNIGGRLLTLVMRAKFTVNRGKLKGKMCIRNPHKRTLNIEFVFELKSAEMLQTVGFLIRGDSLLHNLCKYEFSSFDVSFTYRRNSEPVSILDEEPDPLKRELLEKYLVENFTKRLCRLIQDFEEERLGIQLTVSSLVGNSYQHRDNLRDVNRISHKIIKLAMFRIIDLVNELVEGAKLRFPRIYGLTRSAKRRGKQLKVYKAYINTLHTLAYQKMSRQFDAEVIISSNRECALIYVPIQFWELALHYKEVVKEDSENPDEEFKSVQIYTTEEAHFTVSLRRIEEHKLEIELLQFRIMGFETQPGRSYPINMAMDYLVSSAIEEYMKSIIERTLTDEKLHRLILFPQVTVSNDGDNLYDPDADESEADESD